MRSLACLCLAACGAAAPPPLTHAPTRPPPTRTVEVVDHSFGLTIADPYRWMEGTDNPELAAWLGAQGRHAAQVLARLPGRDALRTRIRELGLGVTAVFEVQLGGGRRFCKRLPAGAQLARLEVQEPDGTLRVLVDPAQRSAAGGHVSLNAYAASPDGSHVAYVLASGGGEVGTVHVMDVASGRELPDAIDRIWGENAAAWLPDGKSFFYTQLAPSGGADPMANQTARLHVLGDPVDRDVTILGREPGSTLSLAPEEWPGLWVPPGSDWVLALVGGAHSEQRVAFAPLATLDRSGGGKTPWNIVAGYADGIEAAVIEGDTLYLQSFHGAPGRQILAVSLAPTHPHEVHQRFELSEAWVVLPESPDAPIAGMYAARDALYVLRRADGRAQLVRKPWDGPASVIQLPYDGWVPDAATDLERDGIVLQVESWLAPGAYFAYDPAAGAMVPAHLASTSTADFSAIAADEVLAPSADGTRVPLTILHRKQLATDGSHPALLYGYGAYGAAQSPGFSATRLAWLERGGVYAIAHVRGGGERGRRWQDDGSREHKLAGIADFVACGEYLIAHGYTSRTKLAADGASMGGILVGRALTARPDLFAAVHVGAGFVDPLRLAAAENGANQKAELGDPAVEADYRALYAMDPYQHVTAGTRYPAVIFTVGLHDHRVAPWMTGKMAARLQVATTSGQPVIVRVDDDAGHGIGSTRDQAFAERADVWAFLLATMP